MLLEVTEVLIGLLEGAIVETREPRMFERDGEIYWRTGGAVGRCTMIRLTAGRSHVAMEWSEV